MVKGPLFTVAHLQTVVCINISSRFIQTRLMCIWIWSLTFFKDCCVIIMGPTSLRFVFFIIDGSLVFQSLWHIHGPITFLVLTCYTLSKWNHLRADRHEWLLLLLTIVVIINIIDSFCACSGRCDQRSLWIESWALKTKCGGGRLLLLLFRWWIILAGRLYETASIASASVKVLRIVSLAVLLHEIVIMI